MKGLYKKSEIWFAVVWIIIYVVGSSIADNISSIIGVEKSVTFLWNIVLTVILYAFVKKNKLQNYYGLCAIKYSAKRYLYFIPLIIIASVNLWAGLKVNYSLNVIIFYIGSMLLIGFLEELIFRGFLFKAMSKDNVRIAIIVSSITFGIGHIVNLLNGNEADILSNFSQVCYAIAIGFLFVTLFHRGKSLWPAIITHSVFNTLHVFANEAALHKYQIYISTALIVISIGYSLILMKTLPNGEE